VNRRQNVCFDGGALMDQILPQFQKFLAERKLAAENQIPFYAGWASKFIRFSNGRQSTPPELKIQLFLDDLRKNLKIQDWQLTQAGNAVRLCAGYFCRRK
jgi:hypothetical protein